MISEGSCDTEDWSNGCFSFANTGIIYIWKYINIGLPLTTIFISINLSTNLSINWLI